MIKMGRKIKTSIKKYIVHSAVKDYWKVSATPLFLSHFLTFSTHFQHCAWSGGLKFSNTKQVKVLENMSDLQTYKSCKIPHIY